MEITVLPVNKTFKIELQERTKDSLLFHLASWAGVSKEKILLLRRCESTKKLVPITSLNLTEKIFFLCHFCGGGKGGFRKQLEKKGREFARAKRQEKNARKKKEVHSSSQEAKSDIKVLPLKKVAKSLSTSLLDSANSRQLVQQGVNRLFSTHEQ